MHARTKPYRRHEIAALLGVSTTAVTHKAYNGTLKRNVDGTYPVAEVEKWKRQRLERITKDAEALGYTVIPSDSCGGW